MRTTIELDCSTVYDNSTPTTRLEPPILWISVDSSLCSGETWSNRTMAASNRDVVTAFVAVMLSLQSLTVTSDFLSPLVSPIFGSICKEANICGKGTCKISENSNFSYECECDDGWKQARPQDNDALKYLPCIIPNCSINQSCARTPSSVEQKAKQANASIFDPCHWIDCGGGSCSKTSAFSYSCLCGAGYYNLLNISSFACYSDCSIGMDCSDLGITVTNQSATSAPPAVGESDQSEGISIVHGRSLWLVLSIVSLISLT